MTQYPYGYCGMPCALCTRFRTDGKSRCPGCSHDGYYTYACKVYACCRAKEYVHCGGCGEYPCVRLGKMGDFKDLNTGGVKPRTCKAVNSGGFDAWYSDYALRAQLLTDALAKYNDGRMKRYLCELFIRSDTALLTAIMERAEKTVSGNDIKENAAAFKRIVRELMSP